jgi:histidyl-tRNA synthetase
VAETTPVADLASDGSRRHVAAVESGLEELGIAVRRAPRLVRGLDYYLRTVFEVISPELGEETVICGGGRYDRLISDLGGPEVPGTGFAIGEDRLIEVLPERFSNRLLERRPVVVLPVGAKATVRALDLVRSLSRKGIVAHAEVTNRSLKAGLKWAAKLGSAVALILGERELEHGEVVIRDLDGGDQRPVAFADAPDEVASMIDRRGPSGSVGVESGTG